MAYYYAAHAIAFFRNDHCKHCLRSALHNSMHSVSNLMTYVVNSADINVTWQHTPPKSLSFRHLGRVSSELIKFRANASLHKPKGHKPRNTFQTKAFVYIFVILRVNTVSKSIVSKSRFSNIVHQMELYRLCEFTKLLKNTLTTNPVHPITNQVLTLSTCFCKAFPDGFV